MADDKVETKSEDPSMRRFTSIGIFGGSNLGKDDQFVLAASELGIFLAAKRINIVYGGGLSGLRGSVASVALTGKSKVLGITVRDFVDKDVTHITVGNELKVSSIPERLAYIFHNSEAFIALPGGLDTLDGISSVAYWVKQKLHHKPLGLLNINGFYDGLLSFLDRAVEQEFISPTVRRTIISASTVKGLMNQLQVFAPKVEHLPIQVGGPTSTNSDKEKLDINLRL